MKLSNKEVYILSDGLLALIQNESEAAKLTNNDDARRFINKTITEYQVLNSKILRFADRQANKIKSDIDVLDRMSAKELHQYMQRRMIGGYSNEQNDE